MRTLSIKANSGIVVLPNGVEVPDSDEAQEVMLDDASFAMLPPGMVGDHDGVDQAYTITVDATDGTYTLAAAALGTTIVLDHDADASDLQSALEGVYGEGNVEVTGTGPFTATLTGSLSGLPTAQRRASYVGQRPSWDDGVRPLSVASDDTTGGAGVTVEVDTEGRRPAILEDVTP